MVFALYLFQLCPRLLILYLKWNLVLFVKFSIDDRTIKSLDFGPTFFVVIFNVICLTIVWYPGYHGYQFYAPLPRNLKNKNGHCFINQLTALPR